MKNLYAAVVLAIIVFFLSSCGEETTDISSQPVSIVSEVVDVSSQPIVSEEPDEPEELRTVEEILEEKGLIVISRTDTQIAVKKKMGNERTFYNKGFAYDDREDCDMLSGYSEKATITYYSEQRPVEITCDIQLETIKTVTYAGKVIFETDPDNIEEDGQFHVYIDGEKAMISYAVVNEWTGQDRRLWLCFGDDIYEVDAYYTCGTSLKNGRFEYRKLLDNYDDDMFDTPWWNDDFDTFYGFFYNSDDEDAPDPDAPYYEVGEIICEDGDIKYLKEGTKTMREHYNELSVWYK